MIATGEHGADPPPRAQDAGADGVAVTPSRSLISWYDSPSIENMRNASRSSGGSASILARTSSVDSRCHHASGSRVGSASCSGSTAAVGCWRRPCR
jgi:hypothetical protein